MLFSDEFEPKSECQLDDASAGIPGVSRFHHRLREIAVQSMIELTAQQRLNRALKSHMRRPLEALQLQSGDEVDFYRPPATKDESGWRGRATVVEIGPPVVIKWQDRRSACRTQDIRRALVYLAFLTSNLANVHVIVEGDNATYLVQSDDPLTIVQSFTDGLQRRMIRIGWLFDKQWTAVKANSELNEILLAALHVAACGLHLVGCVGARIGNGMSVLEGVSGCDDSYVWWWKRGEVDNSRYCRVPGITRIKLSELFHEDKEPDAWRRTSLIQFLLANEDEIRQLRNRYPRVPNLGGPGLTRTPEPKAHDSCYPSPFPTPPPARASINPETLDNAMLPLVPDTPPSSVRSRSPRTRARSASPQRQVADVDSSKSAKRSHSVGSSTTGRRTRTRTADHNKTDSSATATVPANGAATSSSDDAAAHVPMIATPRNHLTATLRVSISRGKS